MLTGKSLSVASCLRCCRHIKVRHLDSLSCFRTLRSMSRACLRLSDNAAISVRMFFILLCRKWQISVVFATASWAFMLLGRRVDSSDFLGGIVQYLPGYLDRSPYGAAVP